MRIHLVTDGQHILGRIAGSLGRSLTDLGHEISQGLLTYKAITNIYLPYYFFRNGSTSRDVCLFTHLETSDDPVAQKKAQWFREAAEACDVAWCMSQATYDIVQDMAPEKPLLIEIPADPQFIRPSITIGICGIYQPFNRKRFDLIPEIQKIPGIEVLLTNGRYPWEDMPSFYEQIDYLLVTGEAEGGPMPLKEAIGMGTPVIAPNTGWCWDYPVIRYEGLKDLLELLEKLSPKKEPWETLAKAIVSQGLRPPVAGGGRMEE